MQRPFQTLCALGVVVGVIAAVLWSTAGATWAPSASASAFDVSGTLEGDGHTIEYTVTGVEPDENDEPFRHSGTVTARQVTLSGTSTYTIPDGFVTNVGMSASLSVADQSAGDSWPPAGTNGRVGGTTVTFPFNLTVDVPPPPPPPETAPPFAEDSQDNDPQPYATLSFSVGAHNCNDSGVCGGPTASGSFLVFPLPTPSPSVDWTATAGALGAVAAVAAAVGIIGRKNEGASEDDEPAERWRYVLQVASDELVVDVGAGAPLDVEVWAVNSKGQVMAAGTAAVTAAISGPFAAGSTSGQGSLHTAVTTAGPAGSVGSALITAVAGPIQMSTAVSLRAAAAFLPQPDDRDEQEGSLTLELLYPAGRSPVVFTEGWLFGARCIANAGTANELDISDTVAWSGSGTFNPPVGNRSRPTFSAEGANTITLTAHHEGRSETKSVVVQAIYPIIYSRVGDIARCDADSHGCPACPHTVVGPVTLGSPTVLINQLPAARQGDRGIHAACCGPNSFTISGGDPNVLIDGRPAARMGDPTTHCGGHGFLIQGSPGPAALTNRVITPQ